MNRTPLRLAFAAVALVAVQARAAVAITEIDFTGVVTSASAFGHDAPAVGDTFTASLSLYLNPGYFHTHTDGSTYNIIDAVDEGTPLMMAGSAAFSSGLSLAFPVTPADQFFALELDRGGAKGLDRVSLTTRVDAFAPDVFGTSMRFDIRQVPGASTHDFLFSDSNGGLSFDQTLNLAGDGVSAVGYFLNGAVDDAWSAGFTVSSISIKEVSTVPEPASLALMLAGAGLVGATLRRRRRD